MYKRFLFTLLCLSLVVLQSCSSDKAPNGSLTIRDDLTISNIELEGATPDFSSDYVGLYEVTVGNEIESLDFTVGQLNTESSDVEIFAFRAVTQSSEHLLARDNEQVVAQGSTFSMPINEGDNLIVVRVRTLDEEQFVDYSFSVHRVSQSADLAYLYFPSSSEVSYVSPEEFDPDVTEYSLSVPYAQCTVPVFAFGVSRYAELFFDGEAISRGSAQYLNLPVGVTQFDIEVHAEDGDATKTYSVSIEREAGTDDEIAADYTLSELNVLQSTVGSLSQGEGFHCGYQNYQSRVDNEHSFITIEATPSVDGRDIQVGRQIENVTQDENGVDVSEYVVEEWFDLPADGGIDFDLNVGEDYVFLFSLRDDDNGDPISAYSLTAVRSETNRTIVETGLELQAALASAEANDEIYIVSSDALTAEASAAASGKEGTVFYSSASGTADQPIVLINATGNDISPATGYEDAVVFELSGDYWQVTGLDVSGGSTGVLLNAASNNVFKTIDVRDSSDVAVQLLNGSNDNAFTDLSIQDASGRGLVVGSDASTWTSAPSPGEFEPQNQNNHFGTIGIGPHVASTHIHVEEGASNTIVRSAVFDLTGLNSDIDTSVIEIQGNDTEISFSEFNDPESVSPLSIVSVADSGYAWLTEQWGENTLFTDNLFNLGGISGVDILSADDTVDQVYVSNNQRKDDGDISYSGVAVDQNFVRPLYQFQWVDWENVADDLSDVSEHTYCLSKDALSLTLINQSSVSLSTVNGVIAAVCDSSSENQQWDLVNDADGYVFISDDAGEHVYAPAYQGSMVNSYTDGVVRYDAENVADSPAYFLRWTIEASKDGQFIFSNKFSRSHVLALDSTGFIAYSSSLVGAFSYADDSDANILYAWAENGSLQSGFTLVPIP